MLASTSRKTLRTPNATSLCRFRRSRRRILAAAEQAFAELGFHSASIVKITEAAGVAQGTFYLYFESKQAVFEEVLLDLNHRVRQAMAEGARDATSREQAERGGFAGFFRFTAEHPALYRVIRQAEFVAPALLERHYATIATGYVDGLRQAMAKDPRTRSAQSSGAACPPSATT